MRLVTPGRIQSAKPPGLTRCNFAASLKGHWTNFKELFPLYTIWFGGNYTNKFTVLVDAA
jgi:hypothetical protein